MVIFVNPLSHFEKARAAYWRGDVPEKLVVFVVWQMPHAYVVLAYSDTCYAMPIV